MSSAVANINPNKNKRWGAYAHFPGTGPVGETCRSCGFFKDKENGRDVKPRCMKYSQLLHRKHLPDETIVSVALACKYWEAKNGQV